MNTFLCNSTKCPNWTNWEWKELNKKHFFGRNFSKDRAAKIEQKKLVYDGYEICCNFKCNVTKF